MGNGPKTENPLAALRRPFERGLPQRIYAACLLSGPGTRRIWNRFDSQRPIRFNLQRRAALNGDSAEIPI